jgi:hypothetical protein
MQFNNPNRDERFFFMTDEPPASGGPDEPSPTVVVEKPEQTNVENAAQRLLKKAQDDLASARQELQSIRDAGLSEVDRLKKHTADLEIRVAASELETLRRKVALEENVPIDALEYLSGSDEDGLRGSARKLVTLIGSKATPGPLGSRTQPGSGQAPSLDEQISVAERSGNRALSIALKNQKMRSS